MRPALEMVDLLVARLTLLQLGHEDRLGLARSSDRVELDQDGMGQRIRSGELAAA
jgi:hypothetical protein